MFKLLYVDVILSESQVSYWRRALCWQLASHFHIMIAVWHTQVSRCEWRPVSLRVILARQWSVVLWCVRHAPSSPPSRDCSSSPTWLTCISCSSRFALYVASCINAFMFGLRNRKILSSQLPWSRLRHVDCFDPKNSAEVAAVNICLGDRSSVVAFPQVWPASLHLVDN